MLPRREFLKLLALAVLGVGAAMARYGTFKYGEKQYGATPAPDVSLLWAFRVDWRGDGSYDVPGAPNNEAGKMTSLTVRRGRDHLFKQGGKGFEPYQSGIATVILDNEDGKYDPWNTSSPLYPYVSPGKFCRIWVRDVDASTNYGVMRGLITNIQPMYRNGRPFTRITVRDALHFLADNTTIRGLHEGGARITLAQHVYEQALNSASGTFSPQYWEWPLIGTSDEASVDYWWAWHVNALEEIHRIMESECGGAFFHAKDGSVVFRPIEYAWLRSMDVDESEILVDMATGVPWESVRNSIRITAYPKKLHDIDATLWELDDVPVALLDGQTYTVESNYRYEQFNPVCGHALNFEHTVNADDDGGGADLTGDCPLTVPADEILGQGSTITITNNSGSDGYIIALYVAGDGIYNTHPSVRRANNAASQLKHGLRTLDLDSLWMEDSEEAQQLADWLLDNYFNPTAAPVIQFEDRPSKQFYVDLYDVINLNIPTLGISQRFRVGSIEHETIGENCQAVRTTMRLEPYTRYGGVAAMAYQGCQVMRSGGQSIPDNAATDILWNFENHDVGGYHSLVANTGRLTVPSGKDGYYNVFTTIQWAGNAAGTRLVRIQKDGVTQKSGIVNDISEAEIFDMHVRATLYLSAGEYVSIQVIQASGGALDVNTGSIVVIDFLGV